MLRGGTAYGTSFLETRCIREGNHPEYVSRSSSSPAVANRVANRPNGIRGKSSYSTLYLSDGGRGEPEQFDEQGNISSPQKRKGHVEPLTSWLWKRQSRQNLERKYYTILDHKQKPPVDRRSGSSAEAAATETALYRLGQRRPAMQGTLERKSEEINDGGAILPQFLRREPLRLGGGRAQPARSGAEFTACVRNVDLKGGAGLDRLMPQALETKARQNRSRGRGGKMADKLGSSTSKAATLKKTNVGFWWRT